MTPLDTTRAGEWRDWQQWSACLERLSADYWRARVDGKHIGGVKRCAARRFRQPRWWWADGRTVGGPFVGRDAALSTLAQQGGFYRD